MSNLAVLGAYHHGNKGAQAMLESITENPKLKKHVFHVYSIYPTQDKEKNKNPNVDIIPQTPIQLAFKIIPQTILYRLISLFKLESVFPEDHPVKKLAHSDIVVDVSGISFSDGRTKQLFYNTSLLIPPLVLGKRILKYSQAIGPFKNPLNRFMAYIFLPQLESIAARGEKTLQYLKDLGLENTFKAADGAFMNTPSKVEGFSKNPKEIWLGLSPSSIVAKNCEKKNIDYVAETRKFIRYATSQSIKVYVIPHSIRLDTSSEFNNDLPVSKRISEGIKDCVLVDKDYNQSQLRYIIGRMDYMVSSRFHAMISSLSMKTPVLVVGWGHKYREVMDSFGLKKYVLDWRRLDSEKLIQYFKILRKNKKKVVQEISRKLPSVVEGSRKNIKAILDMLKNG